MSKKTTGLITIMTDGITFKVTDITHRNSNSLVNYLSEVSADRENNLFLLKWRNTVILKDCDDDGHLLDVTKTKTNPWIKLTARQFYNDQTIFSIFSCEKCCPEVLKLNVQQKPEKFPQILCRHSKVVSELIPNTKALFNFPDTINDLINYKVEDNDDEVDVLLEKKDRSTKSQWLIAVLLDQKVSVLFTTGRQTRPRCSKCRTESCKCVIFFKRKGKEAPTPLSRTDSVESQPESILDNFDNSPEKPIHYEDRDANYGYNFTEIKYPFNRDPAQAEMVDIRRNKDFVLPEELIPEFDEHKRCKHGLQFNESDLSLRLCAPQVTLYSSTKETDFNTKVYYRPTVGPCKCRQYYDGHKYLMYHVAEGKMVCYFALQNYIHSWVNSGQSCYSYYKNMKLDGGSNGVVCSLTYQNWLKACDGFVLNLEFDKSMAFSCPKCGVDPKWFVGDGKCTGFLKKKLEGLNIKEFGCHPDDKTVLSQGSSFKSRQLLPDKSERDIVLNLLSGNIDMDTFVSNSDLKSSAGKMLKDLVNHINLNWPLRIPKVYVTFIADICKTSSVVGLLQVNSSEPLKYLHQFAQKKLDVRDMENIEQSRILMKSLPTFWPQLVSICEIEKTRFLPDIVGKIVIHLINIWQKVFKTSPQRYSDDYFPYTEQRDTQTAFFPNHLPEQHPKRYNVSGKDDDDHCEKTFPSHSDFIDGMFIMGCPCPSPVTYGFELMVKPESARHFFRFLMCRRVNLEKLEGIIEDFACGLHPYFLNREPNDCKFLRFLVDGAHWNGQRKLKKADRSGGGGHLGCSLSYNSSEYQDHLDININTQGREQTNALIEKCSQTLQQKNYFNFMRYMKMFFAIRNLISTKRIKI